MNTNPILRADFPDPDVIRVEDTYYMISTTMHLMPGGVILRSFNLVNWEVASYLYDSLEDLSNHHLDGESNIYGQGMWAGCIRYHEGTFYVCFTANDTKKTYLFTSKDVAGPWERRNIEGFYHDNSILFDEGKVYIVYGNKEIFLTELTKDLSGPKKDGLHRRIVVDTGNVGLGYEGSHIYKINGKYYVFFIHWPADGTQRRTQACYVSDSLQGEFVGRDVLDDDMGYHNQGAAQGGIVDTPDGRWYAMLFQDRGAVGRIPILVPMQWENDFPVLGIEGKVPYNLEMKELNSDYIYEPVVTSDDFVYPTDGNGKVQLKHAWQWNHLPDNSLWSVTKHPGFLQIQTGKKCKNLAQTVNCLTQRMMYPSCEAEVTVDGSELNDGDFAGICALQGCYGHISLTREKDKFYLVMMEKRQENNDSVMGKVRDNDPGTVQEKIQIASSNVRCKVVANFEDQIDEVTFFYQDIQGWKKIGNAHKLYFKLDHFVGCRVGLFVYATEKIGGKAEFSNFVYRYC